VANDVDDLAEKRPKSARVRPGHRGEGAASAGPGRPQVVATTGRRLQQHERARCARLSWWEEVTPKLTQSFGDHYLSRST
jgi:hypothetical protein